MMMAAKHAALITLLALLTPMACQGFITFPILCSGGWARPIKKIVPILGFLGDFVCPNGSNSAPIPLPRPPKPAPSGAGLSVGYYNSSYSNYSCPNAEAIVKKAVQDAIYGYGGRGIGAGLIRLFFHDRFVRGCDTFVLLNTTASGNSDTEREGPPNQNSLCGFEVIDAAKSALGAACPGAVSCADTVAFATRDASEILSNGAIAGFAMPAGRYDGRESFANETTGQLPGPFSDLDTLKARFADQGLDTADMVTLSGAHTVGRARCVFIFGRPDMNQTLAGDLAEQCKKSAWADQDYETPNVLDSQYYRDVRDNDVLFDSDAVLGSPETRQMVDDYAAAGSYGKQWESEFVKAMVKMGNIGVKTKSDKGVEIRKQCWTYNAPPNYERNC